MTCGLLHRLLLHLLNGHVPVAHTVVVAVQDTASPAHLPPEAAVSLSPAVMDPISGRSAASRTLTPITMLSSAVRGMEGLSPSPPSASSTEPTDHRSQVTHHTLHTRSRGVLYLLSFWVWRQWEVG